MKLFAALLITFNTVFCFADCDAPALDLKSQTNEVQGFKVLKLWENENDPKVSSADTKIRFGDNDFLFTSTQSKKVKPKVIKVDKDDLTKKLLKVLKTSPHYLEKEKQQFSILSILGIDLKGQESLDVILFEVSPGANSYTGAIGIINGEWVKLIQPMCY